MYTTTMFHTVISVAGVTPEHRDDLESVTHTDLEAQNYRKLFFRRGRQVGAVMIGDMKGRKKLLELIRAREPVAEKPRRVLELSYA